MKRTARSILCILTLAVLIGLSVLPTFSALAAPTNPGTANLVSWWSLDETSGTRNDSFSTNHLTDNNTVTYATGKIGNAAQFASANSEYLSIADNAAVSMGDIDFTLCGWSYLTDTGGYHELFGKFGSSVYEYTVLYHSAANRFRFYVSNDGTNTSYVTADNYGAVSANQWAYVCAWHDAVANTINIQVNDGTVNSASYSTGVYNGAASFMIGARQSAFYYTGNLDEVALYKKVLSADEKTWLYNSGNGRAFCEVAGNCATATPTASNTPTNTATNTATNTPTATNTATNTATYTPTNTATDTPTITLTPSNTPVNTDTSTPTDTATATETSTPTMTLTPSETPTNTPTPTQTNTPLPTRTPGNMRTAYWDSGITYGDAGMITVTSLLCLVVILGLLAWLVITTLQRKRK
jgi:hypothetical protein